MSPLADIGVYGVGTMGSALALNLAESGWRVAIANREPDLIDALMGQAGTVSAALVPTPDPAAFVASLTPPHSAPLSVPLSTPRKILMMVPAGAATDAVIDLLAPHLAPGDILIDGGNANYTDTQRRTADLGARGLRFVGMGVSGGAEGARHGPSMMVGGDAASWTALRPILDSIAARFDGKPCVAHLGPDGAGHFVKTVHNGIEYADMQMIAELYGLMRDGAGMSAADIGAVFDLWQTGPLASYLVETTARVLRSRDPQSGAALVDQIVDSAGQKGTGRWTVIEALRLGQSASAIEAAVGARAWSADPPLRQSVAGAYPHQASPVMPDAAVLEQALMAGRILAHLQGFDILKAASEAEGWDLDLPKIAEIWRAGCIIRSAFLGVLAPALRSPGPVLLTEAIVSRLGPRLPALRTALAAGMAAGLPLPGLSGGLQWLDSLRQPISTANLIQAQRDAFGAHGFQRYDADGVHHGDWT